MNDIIKYDGRRWITPPEVAKKMENLERGWFKIFETLQEYQNCFDRKRVRGGSVKGGIPATVLATTFDYWGPGENRVLLSIEKNRLYLYHRYGYGDWYCSTEVDVEEGCFLELFRNSYFTLQSIQSWLFFRRFYLPIVIPIKIFCRLVYKHIVPDAIKK